MRRWMKLGAVAIAIGVAAVAALIAAVPELRWRSQVVLLSVTGQLPDVSLTQLLRMMTPGSGYYIADLAESRNPYHAIRNPLTGAQAEEEGERIFGRVCATCHGSGGTGAAGPSLNDDYYRTGDSDWAIFRTITLGIPGTGMAAQPLSEREAWSVIAYLRRLRAKNIDEAPARLVSSEPVTPERLVNDDAEPDDWLIYHGGYSGRRFSPLDEINRQNVHRLSVVWIHQFSGHLTMVETTPVVNGEIMYVTEPPNTVHALDAASGERLWTYVHTNAPDIKICCGQINRGVAVHGDTVYMGTLDAHVLALDARTGRLRWKVKLAEHDLGASITSAPLVIDDLVIVGYGGGDLGFRSFIDAVSASDGSHRWRLYTIPAPGEPGNDTWGGDSWKTGGAASWLTGVYDPELELLYWATGNPAPDYQGELREGDNLYANSVLAIRPQTGELVWHFQFTPHDERDWDANQIPALVDLPWQGQLRKLMLWPNRNGFYYVLDRATGEYLNAVPFVEQNWAHGIDERGRPIENPATRPSVRGTATWPSGIGATNWQPGTFSPRTGLHYVPTLNWADVIYKHPIPANYRPGDLFLGGEHHPVPGLDLYYSVQAIDPATGAVQWRYDLPPRKDWWKTGGLLTTAGDIVFGGDDRRLFVLDAVDGSLLWSIETGGRINAAPMTYRVNGKQRLAMAAGRSIIVLGLPEQ